MDLELNDRKALITGSTSGIGAATARLLASEGAVVAIHGRDEARAEAVKEEIQQAGGRAVVCLGDLATDSGAGSVAESVIGQLGGVDILVNNAGLPEFTGWFDTDADMWARLYNNNVLSMVRMINLLVPTMRGRGWGRIIQIGSVVAWQPFASKPHYCAARAAVVNLTLSLARELAETGITVNTVSPGVILSPPARKFFLEMAEQKGWGTDWKSIEKSVLKERMYNQTGRLGREEDVAHLIAFLCSTGAGYINGANYRIDGGTTGTMN